jgi:NADP-dependent aldehyde dehydrogenase
MNQPKWVLDQIVGKAEEAYSFMKKTTVKERMLFMQSVADSIEGLGQVDRCCT